MQGWPQNNVTQPLLGDTAHWSEAPSTGGWPETKDTPPEAGFAFPVSVTPLSPERLDGRESLDGRMRTLSGHDYDIRPIAATGHSTVYRGVGAASDRVLKVFAEPVSRTEIESNEIYQRSDSPELLSIHPFPEDMKKATAIALKYRGTSLESIHAKNPTFAGYVKLTLAEKIIEAMFNFHEKYDCIHGDIKPGNITLMEKESALRAYLIDCEGYAKVGKKARVVTRGYQPFDGVLQEKFYADHYALAVSLTLLFDDTGETFSHLTHFGRFITCIQRRIVKNNDPIAMVVYSLITDLYSEQTLDYFKNILHGELPFNTANLPHFFSTEYLTIPLFLERYKNTPSFDSLAKNIAQRLINFVPAFHKKYHRPVGWLRIDTVFLDFLNTFDLREVEIHCEGEETDLSYMRTWESVLHILLYLFDDRVYKILQDKHNPRQKIIEHGVFDIAVHLATQEYLAVSIEELLLRLKNIPHGCCDTLSCCVIC